MVLGIDIILRSLWIALGALFWGSIFGISIGIWFALKTFKFKRVLFLILYLFLSLPPITIGLFLYLMFSRSGVFGFLGWLFTPKVMIIAQAIMATPLISIITFNSLEHRGKKIYETALLLGAKPYEIIKKILKEIRFSLGLAVATAFGRVISEVGASTLIGGDIEGKTRVMSTSILTETRMGNFDYALKQALALILISLAINFFILIWQGKTE
jgi:tungstate transport system permease protein